MPEYSLPVVVRPDTVAVLAKKSVIVPAVETLAYFVLKSVVVVRPVTTTSSEFTLVAETEPVSTAVEFKVPYTVAPVPSVSNFFTLS